MTRVMPIAKAEDGSDLLLPEMYVDSEHISDYPVVYMETLAVSGQVGKDDGSGTDTLWTEANLLDEMRKKAGERFSIKKADLPVTEVTVQLEQLERTAEFAWMGDLLKVVLYDMVSVSDPEIGNSMTLKVTELEYDIVKKKISGLKLSNTEPQVARTVTGYNVANGSIGVEKLKDDAKGAIKTESVDKAVNDSMERMPVVEPNTKTQSGIVTKGDGQADKVWATDSSGNPAWRQATGQVFTTDEDETLSWGTRTRIAIVGSSHLHVTMPSNPAENVDGLYYKQKSTGSAKTVTISPTYSRQTFLVITNENNTQQRGMYLIGIYNTSMYSQLTGGENQITASFDSSIGNYGQITLTFSKTYSLAMIISGNNFT